MKQRLPLLLLVLVAIGLLFGGAIHSTLHAHEDGDCHFCHLSVAPLGDEAPVLVAVLPLLGASFEPVEQLVLPARRRGAPPRAPPVA